jgi:hypothetical protein
MKFPLVLLAAIVSSHVIANPKNSKLKGIHRRLLYRSRTRVQRMR